MSNWKKELSPKDNQYGDGWCRDLDRCWTKDKKYVVMSRLIDTKIGQVEHVCIRNRDNTDIPWAEKQKIKNELFGKNRVAIEVFPTEDKLIDQAGMYHLWILEEGYDMPFGIHPTDTPTIPVERPLMRKV